MKVIVGYPPNMSEKGTPLLSQNRQFQYFHFPTFLFPVAMGTAATMLRDKGYETLWVDCIAEGINEGKFYELLEKEKPDVFFFETKAPVVKLHWHVINKIKERFPKLKIVICGDHVTALPMETMKNCNVDYLICGGYFDFAIFDLCESLKNNTKIPGGTWYRNKGKIVENGRYQFKNHLDDAPIIDRVFTKNHLYQREFNLKGRPFAYIMSGRDCWWGKCTFCVWDHTLYPKGTYRARTPENVMKEVKYLVDEIGVREIFDDCGTITVGPWLKKFCQLMIESGYNKKVMYSCNMRFGAVSADEYKLMKKAGFRLLKFGLESGVQYTIDKLDKGTKIAEVFSSCRAAKKAGLTVHLTMMVGYPWETRQDSLKTLEVSKRVMQKGYADVLQATVIIPYPGTPLWYEGMEKDWFRFDPYDYERFDMTEPVFKTPDMSPEEVMGMADQIYTKIFLTPTYMARKLSEIRTFEDLLYTFRGALAVFGHIRDFARPQSNPIR